VSQQLRLFAFLLPWVLISTTTANATVISAGSTGYGVFSMTMIQGTGRLGPEPIGISGAAPVPYSISQSRGRVVMCPQVWNQILN
jgi:hypothetical protein